MKLRSVLARLLALFRRRKLEREVNDEILAHLELAELDARASGLTPEEARLCGPARFRRNRTDEGRSPRSPQRCGGLRIC